MKFIHYSEQTVKGTRITIIPMILYISRFAFIGNLDGTVFAYMYNIHITPLFNFSVVSPILFGKWLISKVEPHKRILIPIVPCLSYMAYIFWIEKAYGWVALMALCIAWTIEILLGKKGSK